MATSAETELLTLTHKLLATIDAGDWEQYASLCDQNITAFEPEANGHLIAGLPFHKFYFDLPASKPRLSSVTSPDVRVVGDMGIVCYTRLVQKLDAQGNPVTVSGNETRIWQRSGGVWKHIHFHRSPC